MIRACLGKRVRVRQPLDHLPRCPGRKHLPACRRTNRRGRTISFSLTDWHGAIRPAYHSQVHECGAVPAGRLRRFEQGRRFGGKWIGSDSPYRHGHSVDQLSAPCLAYLLELWWSQSTNASRSGCVFSQFSFSPRRCLSSSGRMNPLVDQVHDGED